MANLESRIVAVNEKTGEYKFFRDSFIGAGVDSYNNPPSQNPDMFEALSNIQPVTTGNLARRWGYEEVKTFGFAPVHIFEYQNDVGGSRQLVFSGASLVMSTDEAGVTGNASIYVPTGGEAPRMVASRDYAYFFNGTQADQQKWDGSTSGGLSAVGGVAPTTAITISGNVAGSVSLTQGRKYYGAFRNSVTGHTTGLGLVSASTGPLTSRNINLSWAETPADSQFDRRVWLSTLDAGDETTLYLLADTATSATTLVDDVPEETLATRSVWLYTDDYGVEHGIVDNDPPPAAGRYPLKHKGRLFLIDGQYINCSKSQEEVTTSTGTITSRYEESWPAYYQLDISEGAETIRGLLSDGDTLWVGTERHIRKITGSSPDDFSKPEVAFNNVGLVNQDCWKIVYQEGAPVGAVWLTPDFRLMASDFNTYRNIGTPIQDLLDSINPAYAEISIRAISGSDGAFDLYMLAIPTGNSTVNDTLIVYHLGSKRFFIWQLTHKPAALLHNITASGDIQWFFTDATTDKLLRFSHTSLTDAGTGFVHTARTSWLNLGEAACRKLLNELEVMGDTSMLVSIEGASTSQDFASPIAVCTNVPLVLSPFGQYKVYLSGYTTKYRFYRLTFTSTSSTVGSFLDGLNLTVIAENKF